MKKLIPLLFLLLPSIAFAQLNVQQGGTGTSTVPFDYLLVGNSALHLSAIATSSLNLTTSSFASSNISQWTNNSGYITGNQTITLSGAVSGSGATSITTTYAGTLGNTLGGTGQNSSAWTGIAGISGGTWYPISTSTAVNLNISGNSGTATALAANGTNCATGYFALGVDASGNAENCTFAFASTTPWSADQVVVTNSSGVPYTVASSSLGLPNAALLNSSIIVNGTTFNLGDNKTVSAASSTLLGNNNTFSGTNTFSNTISGSVTGSSGSVANSLSNDGATLTGSSFNGSSAVSNWAINLTHANNWTGLQNFTGNASSSIFSVNVGPLYVGGTAATTTLTANATSTFATGLNLTTGCVTYQGGLCLGAAGTFIGGTSLAVQLATTGALPANTYAGGVLTEVGTGALTVDGTSAAVGNRILVKNEVAQTNNGIYSVTAAGSGIAAYVLTRVSDYNSSSNVIPGEATYVIGGTANSDDWWALTTVAPITVGGGGAGSNLTYVETSAAASGVTAVTGTWPVLSSGGTTPVISWGGLSTSTNLVVGNLPYSTGVNTFGQVATSSLGVTSPITFSGTLGAQVGGTGGNFACATCVTSVTASPPLFSSGGTTPSITWAGISTSTNLVAGQVLFASAAGTIAGNTAFTFSTTGNTLLTVTNASTTNFTSGTWAGLNDASSTALSAYTGAFFGATATSSFNSVGTLTLQDADNGYSAIATPTRYLTLSGATTTTMTGTSTASYNPTATANFAGTIKNAVCNATTTASFINVAIYIGTTQIVPDFVASTTANTITFTSNNTFTKGQNISAYYGSSTASTNNVGWNCTLSVVQTS